jgi:hypothetical protein
MKHVADVKPANLGSEVASKGTRPMRGSTRDLGSQTKLGIIVVFVVVALIVAGGILFRTGDGISSAFRTPELMKKVDSSSPVGTIRFSRDGDYCREGEIDNNTGRLGSTKRVECKEPTTSAEPRKMTKRLEAIRGAFNSREP